MFLARIQKLIAVTGAVAAIGCLAGPGKLAAAVPDTSGLVVFIATGTFASTIVSGGDQLQLAGNPFTIVVVANPSMKPTTHAQNYATFAPLGTSGLVYSGAAGATITISSNEATMEQAVGSTNDIIQVGFPLVNLPPPVPNLTIRAAFTLPAGTLSTVLIHPFLNVPLSTTGSTKIGTGTVTYADPSQPNPASTTLSIQSGTVVGVANSGGGTAKLLAPSASATVLVAGAQAVKPKGFLTNWQ